MSAAQHDITLEEESQFDLDIQWEDQDCDPKDITGYGAALQVREERDPSSSAHLEANTSNGQITLDTANGVFRVAIPESDVNGVPDSFKDGGGFFDFLIWPSASSPGVKPKRLVSGRARYERAATYKP